MVLKSLESVYPFYLLSTWQQDVLVLVVLLALPTVLVLTATLYHQCLPLSWSLIRKHRLASALVVFIMALAVALQVVITLQERAIRESSAQAANPFDLIVTVPGDETAALMSSVFLTPSRDLRQLDLAVFKRVSEAPGVEFAAPLSFGDQVDGSPLVGTSPMLIAHLAGGALEGNNVTLRDEAVVGAATPWQIGDELLPEHGQSLRLDEDAQAVAHHGYELRVTGRLPPLGSPYDHAVLVPVEALWGMHGFGRKPDQQLGPPYDGMHAPAMSMIVVRPASLGAAYTLQQSFTDGQTMAFFPGQVLARLQAMMGSVSDVVTAISLFTQMLVAAAIVVSLWLMLQSQSRKHALLLALGAPRSFRFLVVWLQAAMLALAGVLLGLLLGVVANAVLAARLGAGTDVTIATPLQLSDFHAAAGYLLLSTLLAILPAWWQSKTALVDVLRRS